MTVKTITFFSTLMEYAKEKGLKEQMFKVNPSEENKKAFEKAKQKHDDYQKICLASDQMVIQKGNA